MGITYKALLSITKTAPLAPWTAAHIVSRHFCAKLIIHGIACGDCQQICKASICNIFDNLSLANNPAAMVTWRCKNEAAKIIEAHRAAERQEPSRPKFYEETPDNPFSAFLDSL